jgi:hypothetical protein
MNLFTLLQILRCSLKFDTLQITDSVRYIIEGAITDYESIFGRKVDDPLSDEIEEK